MFDLDNWQEIWITITRNKLRSFLTGFGVFWGIFMLVVLIGIGNGFKGGIDKLLDGLTTNTCFFRTDRTSEPYKGNRKGRFWQMNSRDLILIRQKAYSVDAIAPVLYGGGTDKNVVRGMKSGSYMMMGIMTDQYLVQPQIVHRGRLLNEMDIEGRRKVCVIGNTVYKTLFAVDEDPLGQYIRVNGIYFQVVGVTSPVSRYIQINGNAEETVFLPFSTMRYTFSRGDRIHVLACTAKPGFRAAEVEQEVGEILRTAHDIAPTDKKALRTLNVEQTFMIFRNLSLGVNLLVWIVGLGALLSGIIGISNIMLVTVRERMREIGVRRALGASPLVILRQIMSESVLLTAIAGLGGFLLGVFTLWGVSAALTMSGALGEGSNAPFIPPFISFEVGLLSMLILILSGVVAGIMPTMRALQVKAIDAIRDE